MTDTEKSEAITFPIQYDTYKYGNKEECKNAVGGIKNRLGGAKPVNVTVEQLAQIVMNGQTVQLGVLQGGSKAENWVYQQAFALDIDNEDKTAPKGSKTQAENPLTLDKILERCKKFGIMPALIYKSFSSCKFWEKFRVIFICEKLITEEIQRKQIQLALMNIFPECDVACKNADRVYFGTKKHGVCFSREFTFNPEELPQIKEDKSQKQAGEKSSEKCLPKTINTSNSELDRLKKSFDFLGYIRHNFNCTVEEYPDRFLINPCPVCGHNNDFNLYRRTNSFKCFSTNGDVGGSIIDFLMYTKKIDKAEAIKYFKYELCGIDEKQDKANFRKNKMIENARNSEITFPKGELPPFIGSKINEKTGEVIYFVLCPQLAQYIREHCHYITLCDKFSKKNRMFWYINGVYKPANDDMIQGYIKRYITAFDESLLKMRDVREVFLNLKTDLKFVAENDLNADENIINFQNGLYYISERALKPHSPDVLTTIQIPCDYNPDNHNTEVFDKFLNELTEGNKEKQELLLEFMGVAISNIKGYRMKKALFMFGEGNTGKSQLKQLTERLIGSGNYSNCDLAELEKRFGTSNLYMKRLSGSSEMSFVSVSELKIFKQATGGDDIFCEFKGKDGISFKFNGLLWYCTNELPSFGGDRGKWVYERIIPLECRNVIPKERQDKQLVEKLFTEREAIINKLIPAIERVIANGYNFTIPEECNKKLAEYRTANSPVLQFIDECCTTEYDKRSDDTMKPEEVYKIFKMWYSDNYGGSCRTLSKQAFNKEIANFYNVSKINDIKYTAELWLKIGYRDRLVSNEEISCIGCRPENWCRYHVVKCCEDKGIKNCSECAEFPCDNIRECFAVTKSFEPKCREVCTEEEYEQMKKAFFEKEENLKALQAANIKDRI